MAVMVNASEQAGRSSGTPGTQVDEQVDGGVTRVVLGVLSLALLVSFGLILLLVEARWGPLLRLDLSVRDGLNRYALAHGGFVEVMKLISGSGSGVAWVIVLTPVVAWLLWRRLTRLAVFVAVTALGSALLNAIVKANVDRLRPVLEYPVAREAGLSFPSAHAQAAVVGCALLLLIFLPILAGAWRRVAETFAVLAVLAIGFSRIALGVHYVSDVAGGFALGAAWVAVMTTAFHVVDINSQRRAETTSRRSTSEHQPIGGATGR